MTLIDDSLIMLAAGKLKAPELTARQKEAVKQLLESEAATRAEVATLVAAAEPVLDLVASCLAGAEQGNSEKHSLR